MNATLRFRPFARLAPAAIVIAALACLTGTAASKATSGRPLGLEERVQAQRAIEEVYWRHRIWPKENPTPQPPLSAVVSDAAIRAKVEDYLKKSNALETPTPPRRGGITASSWGVWRENAKDSLTTP